MFHAINYSDEFAYGNGFLHINVMGGIYYQIYCTYAGTGSIIYVAVRKPDESLAIKDNNVNSAHLRYRMLG